LGNLAPFKAILTKTEAKLRAQLASGKGSVDSIAYLRRQTEIMAHELKTAPKSVLAWEKMGEDPKYGFSPAQRWAQASYKKAFQEITPQYGSQQQQVKKFEEYLDFSQRMLLWGRRQPEVIQDKKNGVQYLILGADPLVPKIMAVLASELMKWYRAQPNTKRLMSWPAKLGLAQMLQERPDLAMLLRISQTIPALVEKSNIPVDRPAAVVMIETAIAIIPVVGNAVAAYEAWSGRDLFGYKLSDLERGVLAASVLLPIAGRVVKSGRALYSEARLVRLYGEDARLWSRAIGASGNGMARRQALAAISQAERDLLRKAGVLTGNVGKEAAGALKSLSQGAATLRGVDQEVVALLNKLQNTHKSLKELDAEALHRILEKGPYVPHLKGQLLEEIVESRIVPWLAKREGAYALGIKVPSGKKLEFIPGHLVRDPAGRQITDGMLIYRNQGDIVIAAVFEAKAGKSAARELSYKGGGKSSLTKAEKLELRANAKDVWRDQREEALAKGKEYTKTIDDVEKEYVLSERGGQVRRDIERLGASTKGPAQIRIGAETFTVQMSPTKTKFFGIVPKGVNTKNIEKQLAREGASYEILGVDINTKDLKSIAEEMEDLATKLAESSN
jgi:hypothetical protein